MKLELHHLTPYLPYRLLCQYEGIINGKDISAEEKRIKLDQQDFFDFQQPIVLPIIGTKTGYLKRISAYKNGWIAECGIVGHKKFYNGNGINPLLRPLSQLTKEINHGGQTFIPMVELLRLKESNYFSKDALIKNSLKNYVPEIVSCKGSTYEGFLYSQVEYLVRTGNMGTLIYEFSYDNRFDRFSLCDTTRDKNLGMGHQLQLFEKLYEWKFDLFGLLDNNLALPIQD